MVAPSMIWHVCRKLSDKRNRLEIGMPAMETVKIIAALLIGLFLSVPHAALAQEPDAAGNVDATKSYNSTNRGGIPKPIPFCAEFIDDIGACLVPTILTLLRIH